MKELIKKYEGLRLKAYLCPAGIPTIGYGTTYYPNGKQVSVGDIITQEEAERYLDIYLQKEVWSVFHRIKYELTDGQKMAIASLVYNVGRSAFLSSKLFIAINRKDLYGIFKEWDFGVKSRLKGLVKRRAEELYLFTKDL